MMERTEKSRLFSKQNLFFSLTMFYVMCIVFPIVDDYFNIPIALPGAAVSILLLLFFYDRMNRKILVPTALYVILLFAYSVFGNTPFINGISLSLPFLWRITIETAWILPGILIMTVMQSYDDVRLYRKVGYGTLLLLVASFIYLLPLLRESAIILRYDLHDEDRMFGLPGYTLMHAYTFFIMPLVWGFKYERGYVRWISLALLILFEYMIVSTYVTTSLLISVSVILFVLVCNAERIRVSLLRIAFIALVIALLYKAGFFLKLVERMMPFYEGTAVSFKLQDLYDSMVEGRITGGSITGRIDYHKMSRFAFLHNPLFGAGADAVGGHSKLLDILGSMGLVVFIPFCMIIWNSFKSYFVIARDRKLKCAICISYVVPMLFLYYKGLFGAEGWLAMNVLVPSILMSRRKND